MEIRIIMICWLFSSKLRKLYSETRIFLKRYLRRVTFKLNLLATIWQIWRLVGPRWPRSNCHVELNCRSLSLEVKLTKKIISKLKSVILGWKKANCMKIYDTGTVHQSYSTKKLSANNYSRKYKNPGQNNIATL